jgi:hypothetical protein
VANDHVARDRDSHRAHDSGRDERRQEAEHPADAAAELGERREPVLCETRSAPKSVVDAVGTVDPAEGNRRSRSKYRTRCYTMAPERWTTPPSVHMHSTREGDGDYAALQ